MLEKAEIYLDANAGAPLKIEAAEALLSFLKAGEYGILPANPSSIHRHGRKAKQALAEAREQVASSLGQVDPEQLIFTSSGTEANQLAIHSILEAEIAKGKKPHWITSPVEHDSVRSMISWLEKLGGTVSLLPVDENGAPRLECLKDLIAPNTALISLVWVNNETGVICNIHRAASIAQSHSIPLHVDASQAWGKLPIDLNTLGAKLVSFSGHKIGALGGTGVLWLSRGVAALPVLFGKQEKGRRGGTENLLGIITLGAAAQGLDPVAWAQRVAPLRDRLQDAICQRIPNCQVNGAGADRVANTLNLSFAGVEGDGLVMALDLAGYSVSSGSACSSGVLEPSHVLLAMGRTKLQAMAAVRVSLADEVSWDVLDKFVTALEKTVKRVRLSGTKQVSKPELGVYL